MATLQIETLHVELGARVTGVDLAGDLDDETVEAIHAAVDRYSFLAFPGQAMDDERQLAFTARLGEPENSHTALGEEGRVEYLRTIGNVQDDGTVLGNDHRKTIFLTGNNMWHSDSSFRKVPSYVSIMCPYEVPAEGGLTEFASQRAAWARLPAAEKERIDPLIAIHDYTYSRSKVAPDAVSESLSAALPPVRQKLVRRNPRTGEKNYYVGSHAKEIEGWSFEESRALIEDLIARATAPEHVYTHRWVPGEVVIWDNRCLLHRGSGYDADRYRRRMRQTRVLGAGPTLEE